MDAISMLESDHAGAKKAMEEIAGLPPSEGSKKKKLFDKLKKELEVHDSVEENVFYPEIQKQAKGLNYAAPDRAAHETVEEALAQLEKLSVNDEAWMTTFRSMQENLLRHVKDEETGYFVKIRQALSATQLDDLGSRMKSEKERQMKPA